MNKKGDLMGRALIHIILIAIIMALLVTAVAGTANSRGVRQQILEKQTALLLDSAVPGMEFIIPKKNIGGFVHSVDLRDGNVFVGVDNFKSLKGYPYFTRYSVDVRDEDTKFVVSVS